MEDPAISLVGVVNSYSSQQQQPQQRQPSPDLIQLSDSDSNLPPQTRHEPGYTIMQSEDCDLEDDDNNDGEDDGNDNHQQVCSGDLAPLTAECVSRHHSMEDRELLEDGMEEYVPGVIKGRRGDRRGTSGSSDPGLSSPGSVSSPGSDSATPTNMLASHHHDPSAWATRNTLPASHRHASNWHRLVNDEHCQLLGTEEDSSDRHSSNEEEEEEEEDQLLQNAQEVCMDPLPSPAEGPTTSRTSNTSGRPHSGSNVSIESASFVNNNTTSSTATDTTQHRTVPAEPPDARVGGGDSEGIWRISDEQLAYYTQQFRRLQPDLNKALSGHQAKLFFEKSKLPTEQLTRIWHLSDVTQDGALSLPEFLVAMHLVVARRNSIPLPAALPPPLLALLLPSLQQHQPTAGHHKQQQAQQENCVQRSGGAGSSSSGTSSVVGSLPPPSTTAPTLPPSDGGGSEGDKDTGSPSRAKEWTKFADSPTSTVSSPGLKPVNFDFQRNAVEKDPKILHPKALRLTPEPSRGDADTAAPNGSDTVTSRASGPTSAPHPSHEPLPSTTSPYHHHHHHHLQHHQHTGSSSSSNGSDRVSPTRRREKGECQPGGGGVTRRPVPGGLHRPLPRKPPPHGGPLLSATSLGNESSQYGPASLPLGGVTSPVAGGKREHHPPPPPPPRPVRTHTRSSSLDLNKFNRGCFGAPSLGAPPAVPPRASPGTVSPSKKLVYQRSDGDASGLRDEHQHTSSSQQQQHAYRQKLAAQPDHLLRLENSLPLEQRQQVLAAADQPRASAFEVYRKPSTGDSSSAFDRAPAVARQEAGQREAADGQDTGGSSGSSATTAARLKDKKEVCASIRTTRDRNTILARLNTELNQELAEVIEERIALEMQLEQMKLFTN